MFLSQRWSRFLRRSRRRRRQRHTIQFRLELDDLLQHRIWNTDEGSPRPLTKMVGVEFTPTFVAQSARSIDGFLGRRGCGAGSDLGRILACFGFGVLQSLIRSGRRKSRLVSKSASENLKKASLPPALATQ
jgi:hypothetical protein